MLSRTAERMYWFGRYLERTENTARLVSVNANLLMDLPILGKEIWDSLIDITGSNSEFYSRYSRADERNVIRFLLADEANTSSMLCSIRMARENVRTAREILPNESWEEINGFYLFVRQNLGNALKRDGRQEFLDDVVRYCHQITGLLISNMTHGEAYNFIRIGRNLERADMTTRIVDVGSLGLAGQTNELPDTFETTLWMNVLRSLSAYQMYRLQVRDKVNGEDVVAFLMKNNQFPRAAGCCLAELNQCVSQLPKNDAVLRSNSRLQRLLSGMDTGKVLQNDLHQFIDELQVALAGIHEEVSKTWFEYAGSEHVITAQEQTG